MIRVMNFKGGAVIIVNGAKQKRMLQEVLQRGLSTYQPAAERANQSIAEPIRMLTEGLKR